VPLRIFEVPSFDGSVRTARVYTPDAYDEDPGARFGVVYLQDGQNVFADPRPARPETWCADLILEQLASEGRIEPWILVGLDHAADRFGEYSPWDYRAARVKAKGKRYARYLAGELKPMIDQAYRTRPGPEWTAAVGSSLGGLISLYLGLEHGDVFGRIGALSPTVMWSGRRIFREWRTHRRRWTRIYLDAGAHEVLDLGELRLDYGRWTREFHAHLERLGYAGHELALVLEPGGQHSEVDWRRRLPLAFRWLLG